MPVQVPFPMRMKTILKMILQRIKFAYDKGEFQAKQARKEVSKLLKEGKETKASFKVETMINEDIHLELLEILELYCEMLYARYQIVGLMKDEVELIEKHMEDGINEAIRSLVYSALYVPEIKELLQLRDLFRLKFGVEFINCIVQDEVGVPDKIVSKCCPKVPSTDIVDLYLCEIAKAYEVPYSNLPKEKSPDSKVGSEDELDNTSESVNLNDETKNTTANSTATKPSASNKPTEENKPKISESFKKEIETKNSKKQSDQELEDLKKRFEALKR
ncbi:hypothetical protein ACO0RG_001711 [Hanseniaspora osmophila]|uniref:Vacuolar protein sorting-associated protein IST1 n=1 Tax=Hanseniaspora osmophila TaxID=56408 RepID=A0A1E5RGI1_9ASCO|nr:Vacuolar protein sorting-associated protein IST1 [Hanseniaspora osmophila]